MTRTLGERAPAPSQASGSARGTPPAARILVTGGCGYLGTRLVAALVADPAAVPRPACVVVADVRDPPAGQRAPGVHYAIADVRASRIAELIREHAIDTVVHLANVVNPGPGMHRALMRSVDVDGTRNVLDACVACGVRRIVVASSGAAYGFHADLPARVDEDQPLRGQPGVVHADHRRLVEEMLAEYRTRHPALGQVVLRLAPVLGPQAENRVTALFDGPVVLAVRGANRPFVLVHERDAVGAIVHAIVTDARGIYNVAADGALDIHEIAQRMGRRCVAVPAWLLGGALAAMKRLGLTRYGGEQAQVLRHRPALDNRRMKEVLGYTPRYTTEEVFESWRRARTREHPRDTRITPSAG